MRRLNKHQKIILLVSIVIAVIIGLIAAWIFFQYKTVNSPGSTSNQESNQHNTTSIPSVSGQGHVPGDDYVYDKNGNKVKKNKDNDDPSDRKSSDPIYSAPNNGQGSGEFNHNIDDSCFTAEQDRIARQIKNQTKNELNKLHKNTEEKITKLIRDIDNAKTTILNHDKLYEEAEVPPPNRKSVKRPSKPYSAQEVKLYASAWTDTPVSWEDPGYKGHNFIDRADSIYMTEVNKENSINTKYTDLSCSR